MRDRPDGPAKFDPNQFGTADFVRFCRMSGGEPYLAANMRSLPARDFYQWIEFCNSPAGSTTLADLRAKGGDREPFGVRYWGVGNETWGCGGNFTAEEYATEYRATRPGCRSTAHGRPSSAPDRTAATCRGRAGF
jgi:alpha-N-arabinofuranosidase